MFYEEYDYTDVTSESFKVSETYGLQNELTKRTGKLHAAIERCFCGWVENVDLTEVSPQMCFAADSCVISFNYTPTLQLIYSVDDASVLHIHDTSRFYSLSLEPSAPVAAFNCGPAIRSTWSAQTSIVAPKHGLDLLPIL